MEGGGARWTLLLRDIRSLGTTTPLGLRQGPHAGQLHFGGSIASREDPGLGVA